MADVPKAVVQSVELPARCGDMGKRGRAIQPAGSMRQRTPGSWELRAYAGVDALTGKVRYRTRTVRASKAEAAKALRELVASAQAGPAFGAQASFATLLEAWISAKEPGWSKGTLRETKSIVGHHVRPRLGGVPVGAITTAQIDQMLAELGRSSLSAATVGRIRGVVHASLAQAVRRDWIWSNPATNATRIDVGPRCHVVPEPAVVTTVLESLRRTDPMLMTFVRLAATTGARRGEILGLSWADVDLVHGRVRLVRGLIDAAGGPVLQDRKTKNANCVDLDAETVELLRTHREQCPKRAAARGVPVAGCPLFSTADVMTWWKPNWVTKRFAVALGQAGVEHFRLHDLRHFVARQLLASGVGLPVVSARLGHARSSTTLNVYAASMPAWDRAAAETLSTLIRAS